MVANETIPVPFTDFAPPVRAPSALRAAITKACRRSEPECAAALIEPDEHQASHLLAIAAMEGPIPLVQTAMPDGSCRLEWLVEEQSTSINTTAAGGNASLMVLV